MFTLEKTVSLHSSQPGSAVALKCCESSLFLAGLQPKRERESGKGSWLRRGKTLVLFTVNLCQMPGFLLLPAKRGKATESESKVFSKITAKSVSSNTHSLPPYASQFHGLCATVVTSHSGNLSEPQVRGFMLWGEASCAFLAKCLIKRRMSVQHEPWDPKDKQAS